MDHLVVYTVWVLDFFRYSHFGLSMARSAQCPDSTHHCFACLLDFYSVLGVFCVKFFLAQDQTGVSQLDLDVACTY